MAYLKDIIINITRATKALMLAGFGRMLILGETAPYYLLTAGTGNAGLKVTAKTRGTVYVRMLFEDPAGNNEALSVVRTGAGTVQEPCLVTVSLATNGEGEIVSTASAVKTAIQANNEADAIIDVALVGDGAGVMPALNEAPLSDPGRYHEFSELLEVATVYSVNDPEYKMAAAAFAQSPAPSLIAIYSRDLGAPIPETLNKITASVNNKWYGLLINNRTKAEIQAAGTWASANKKLFLGCTDDVTTLDDRNNDYEAIIVHDRPLDYPDAAAFGQNLAKAPGSITWKWKTLAGQLPCGFDTTTLNTIREKHGIALTEYGGITILNEGTVTSGEYIDVIMGMDWVASEIEARLFKLFIDNDKVSLDNDGIAQVKSVLLSVMSDAGAASIIAAAVSDDELKRSPDGKYLYTVTVPQRDDISANDRAQRLLPNVDFTMELAGAIHKVNVSGRVAA